MNEEKAEAKGEDLSGEDDEEEEAISEEDWKSDMKSILDNVEVKGDYCFGEQIMLPPFHPKITVTGMSERLAFPLPIFQAKQLIDVAEKAPFGKGTETVLDESVRKAWQVDAANVLFDDLDTWNTSLQSLTKKCVAAMGLSSTQQSMVRSNLYKMLIYEPGGHFQKHRDTEKEPGMFGTLVIQLPSKHEGGGLVINHRNDTRTFDFSRNSQEGSFVTAFFADCEHEFLQVSEGYRLCLVYNLVMLHEQTIPTAEALTAQTHELRRLAQQHGKLSLDATTGYLLEHKYTKTNLRFQNLKGRDKQVADLLQGVEDEEGNPLFVAYLLLIEKWESGSASGGGYSYRDRYGDESSDGEHMMEEVHETHICADFWVGPDDRQISKLCLGFCVEHNLLMDDEMCEDDLFEGEDPDQEEYEGYTGNAGPSLEYWYYKSALVFWPRSSQMAIAARAGIDFLLSSLTASTVQSDIQGYGAQIVKLVETRGQKVTLDVLKALVKVADESLIVRALKNLHRFTGNGFPLLLVQVVHQFKSEETQGAILDMLKKSTILLSKDGYGSLEDTVRFLELLDTYGPDTFFDQARAAVATSALVCIEHLVKRESQCKLLIPVMFHLPDEFPTFIDALITHGKRLGPSLSSLLESMPTAPTNQHVTRLAKARIEQLQTRTAAGRPTFSWRQPQAKFPGSQAAAVTEFLRGPEQSREFYGFNRISHARNWAHKYFGYGSGSSYSATAQPSGRGSSSSVVVTKTKTAHARVVETYDANLSELQQLCSIFGQNVPPAKRSAEDPTPASTKKVKPATSEGSSGDKDDPIVL